MNRKRPPRPLPEFTRDRYRVNGVRTVVYTAGRGRPLVYLHGGGTFHGIEFAREWATRFKVIAPHHPGYGQSGDAPHLATLNDYLLHYLELFEMLGLKRFDLVGASLGGWMAAEFAVAHRERLRRLVLVAPAGLLIPEYPSPDLAAIPREDFLSYLVNEPAVLAAYLPRTEAETEAFSRLLAREGRTFARIAPAGPVNPNLHHWLHRITMPTLLVWPRQDRILPVGQSKAWMRGLPDATLALIDGAGHLVLDESAEARRTVLRFLAR